MFRILSKTAQQQLMRRSSAHALWMLLGALALGLMPFIWMLSPGGFASAATLFNLTGEVSIADVDNGGPSLNSDRVTMVLDGLSAPPEERGLRAYLLDSALQASICTAPLTIENGALDASFDFPGQNLIGSYDSFRLMQETEVYSVTLDAGALGHLQSVLTEASDTPNMIGYGIGLKSQAKLLANHAQFATNSLNGTERGRNDARKHTEHVLNILYGSTHPNYGDLDNNGFPENPGDDYGLLTYHQQMSQSLEDLENSGSATDMMLDQAGNAKLALENMGDGIDTTGLEQDKLATIIERATLLLASDDEEEMMTLVNQINTAADRVYNGYDLSDDGTISPDEGGALDAFAYAQKAAAFPGTTDDDSIYFSDSSPTAYNDQLKIVLSGLPEPNSGESYWAYLIRSDGQKIALGAVEGSAGAVEGSAGAIEATVSGPGSNLANYQSSFQLTMGYPIAEDQLAPDPLQDLRTILARATDTPNLKGYGVGLAEQAKLIATHAGFALNEMQKTPPNLLAAKVHTEHVLNIFYSDSDEGYGDRDNNGFTENPGDTYGLLNYRSKMSEAMQQAADSPSAEGAVTERRADVQTSLDNLGSGASAEDWVSVLIEKAEALLTTSNTDDANTFALQMVAAADRIYNGTDGVNGDEDGVITPGEGGALSAYQSAQKAIVYNPVLLATPEPETTATATPTPQTATPTPDPGITITPPPDDSEPNADGYENDDLCENARSIQTSGVIQNRTFHDAGDSDWVRFDAVSGQEYRIEVKIPPGSSADVAMELYPSCGSIVEETQDNSFSPDIVLNLAATQTSSYYMKFSSHDPSSAGANINYDLTVRSLEETASPGLLILVAGSIKSNDPVQPNIYNVTDNVYQLFINNKYTDDRIYYLAPDVSRENVDASSSVVNLEAAITEWAVDNMDSSQAVTIYMMDHGAPELFYLDKQRGEWVTPNQLDGWLSEFEAAKPEASVNVIIEACYSGSFISEPGSISSPGRVIVTSADDENLAWASSEGAQFSDHFLAGLGKGESLYQSFNNAQIAASIAHPSQVAWLDGDGDGNALDDGAFSVAAQRGFNAEGGLPDDVWSPFIKDVEPIVVEDGSALLRAEILDDVNVNLAYAVVYPPSYVAPEESEALVQEALPTSFLIDQNDGYFQALHQGFREDGTYRVVFFATDNVGLDARPVSVEVTVGGADSLYLPLMLQ